MKREWEEFRTAFGFLTVLPVAANLQATPERLGRSMGFFPAAGLAIGLVLVVLNWGLAALIPRPVLDCLLLLILIALTGALHLDGMADMVDGLSGGRDREAMLRITSAVPALTLIWSPLVVFLVMVFSAFCTVFQGVLIDPLPVVSLPPPGST
jgi:adenosylcobinamide-GDP ribazoletransferase